MNGSFKQPVTWQSITALLGAGILGFFLFLGALIIFWPILLISAIYVAILKWKIKRAMKEANVSGQMSATEEVSRNADGSYTKKVVVTVIDEDGNEL